MVDRLNEKIQRGELPQVDLEEFIKMWLLDIQDLDSNFLHIVDSVLIDDTYTDPEFDFNLKEYILQKNYVRAFAETFRLIGSLFSGIQEVSGVVKYEKFAQQVDFSHMTNWQIKQSIVYLQYMMQQEKWLQRNLYLTKLLSNAQDQIYVDQQFEPYQYLGVQLEVWDVLLMNKRWDSAMGANLLRGYEKENPIDFTHVVLVSENKDGVIKCIHSTMHKETEEGSGVEEFLLSEYVQKYTPIDFLVLEQMDEMKQKTLDFAHAQIGKGYDFKIAIAAGLWTETVLGERVYENELYNCVELIAQAYIDFPLIKKIAHPNEFLEFGVFKMKYILWLI